MNPEAPPPPAQPRARITRLLVVVNLTAFVLIGWLRLAGVAWTNAAYGMVPSRLSADPVGEAIKLVSSLFVHDGLGHLLWNLLFLLLFGRRVERSLGGVKYLLFFLMAGVLGGLAQFAAAPQNPIPLVGASGAIAGLLGGFLVLFPREPITIFQVPAYKLIVAWFAVNLLGLVSSLAGDESDTAFLAHMGGFAAGLILVKLFAGFRVSDDGDWPGFGEPTKIARPPIFKRGDDRPFWRT